MRTPTPQTYSLMLVSVCAGIKRVLLLSLYTLHGFICIHMRSIKGIVPENLSFTHPRVLPYDFPSSLEDEKICFKCTMKANGDHDCLARLD